MTSRRNPKTTRTERIEELKRLAEKIGLWNINRTEIAKKYGVNRRTIYTDIESLFKEGIEKDSVNKAKVNINNLNKSILTELQAEFIRAKGKDKATIANALLSLQEKHIDFLERFGEKQTQNVVTDNKIEVVFKDELEDD